MGVGRARRRPPLTVPALEAPLLRENVGTGALGAVGDDAAVRGALARARAEGIERRVPGGLDGLLERGYGDGRELSGGQWQALALARSLMRSGPLVLTLDEPAAALDAAAEHALFESFARAAEDARAEQGSVTLFVSHRFSTVRMADRIAVLQEGRLADLGSHEELMRRAGLYADLYRMQARAYA